MKKLYTLLLAAAVTLTAAAASRTFKMPVAERHLTPSTEIFTNVNTETPFSVEPLKVRKAPAKVAGQNAPTDLETLTDLTFCYMLNLGDDELESLKSTLSFKQDKVENGYIYYTMTGLLEGIFKPEMVTIHPITVLYDPAKEELIIPCGQTLVTFNNKDFTIYNHRQEDDGFYGVPFYFSWNGNGFTWENPVDVQFEENTPAETFTSADLAVGTLVQGPSGEGISLLMQLSELGIKIPSGTWSTVAHIANDELTETTPQDFSTTVYTTINGSEMLMDGFFQYDNILFTIDYTAKTLTAENQKAGQMNIGTTDRPNMVDTYLSEATNTEDLIYADNAYPFGVYKLEMTYEVADGKTNITCPNWNIFAPLTDGKENFDIQALVPFTDTKITLNYELTAISGISNVTVADENAPVEYYNLQGVRVANPESGLYIKRQGNKATKVLVK